MDVDHHHQKCWRRLAWFVWGQSAYVALTIILLNNLRKLLRWKPENHRREAPHNLEIAKYRQMVGADLRMALRALRDKLPAAHIKSQTSYARSYTRCTIIQTAHDHTRCTRLYSVRAIILGARDHTHCARSHTLHAAKQLGAITHASRGPTGCARSHTLRSIANPAHDHITWARSIHYSPRELRKFLKSKPPPI